MSNKLKGIIFTLIGGSLWGFSGVCGQYLFQIKNIDPQWLSAWRIFASGLMILIFLIPKEKKNVFNVFSKDIIVPVLIFSFVSVMGCQYSYFMAIYYSNSATATVLEYIAPALVMLFTCISMKKKPSAIQFLALLCAMSGVFIMATGGNVGSLSISAKALFWGLLGGLTYAIYTIQSPTLSSKCGVLHMLGWGNLIGSIPLLIMIHSHLFDCNVDIPFLLAFLGTTVLGSITSFGVFIKGCQLAGSVTGSLCACVEPLSSAIISYLWLGTQLRTTDMIGLILIVATVVIITLDKGKIKL